jgi:hypothetical protein
MVGAVGKPSPTIISIQALPNHRLRKAVHTNTIFAANVFG